MARNSNMTANTLTLSRLGFLLIGVYLLYQPGVAPRTVAFALVWIVLLIDALDGPIARRRGETSTLGSILDIAIDRVVENVYWIAYTDLHLVPAWVAFVAVTRGILTDAVRGQALAEGQTPFEMMRTRWGRRLVSHRFLRAFYGIAKAVTFAGLAGYLVLEALWTGEPAARFLDPTRTGLLVLVYVTVGLNLLRGLPVLIEARRYFQLEASR
jgi:CDP-diacylglycerol--glycerol-3-phosphate 3-phosphatidyltransferase